MTQEQWLQVKEIFYEALECAPEARAAFLQRRCDNNVALLRELHLLLESHDQAEDFIEQPALRSASEILSANGNGSWAGRQIGPYSVLREIGRGGMGVVLLGARADDQFKQYVAIKLIKRGLDTEDILRRFLSERQILASLNHPHIAKLFDGGTTADGLPYFVMEYIAGLPLLRYCDEHDLSLTERLQLFRTICSAVQHAHQNLVIHRDLKPSNIIVTHEGAPKLLDFGVAKFLNPELMDAGFIPTQTRGRILTPEYASPEQVRGAHVTTATDIYSLGVILYELLTGVRPYQLKDTSLEELAHVICESEPAKPSDASSRSHRSQTSSGSAQPTESRPTVNLRSKIKNLKSLKGDLDNVVLMALRKEPSRRYKSVEQFSEDIRRYLEGLPVIARQDTFTYRASKFIGRNKVSVAAAGLVLLAIIAGMATTIWEAHVARQQRDAAQTAQAKAERINEFLATALSYSDPAASVQGTNNRRDATINQMLDDVAPRIDTELAGQPEVKASLERTIGTAYLSQARLADAEHYLTAALETQLKLYGENNLETAYTLSALAYLQSIKGDHAVSEANTQRALAIYRNRQQAGQTNPRALAVTLANYGDVLWTKGDYQGSESAYSEALTLASQLGGGDRESIASANIGLGSVRYAQGRLGEAEALLREAVAEYRARPRLRWRLAYALNLLGQILTHKREFDEALTVLRESETISREIFGENNDAFARTLYLEAYALCFKGDYQEAESTLSKVEAIYRRYYPEDKISRANLDDLRGMILTRTGHPQEGETFGRQATELYQGFLKRGANGITLARLHWAESLTAQRKYEAAEKILLEAYQDASEVQGAQHWRTKDVALALAHLYETWGKPELAKGFLSKAS